jgi:hypothetical protein
MDAFVNALHACNDDDITAQLKVVDNTLIKEADASATLENVIEVWRLGDLRGGSSSILIIQY